MTSDHAGGSITSVLQETRSFPPPGEFASKAHISSMAEYEALWNRAKDDPEGFWGEQAQRLATGHKPWDQGAGLAAAVCEVVRRRPAQCRRITASTATARARPRTRRPSSGRASPAIGGCCAIKTCCARSRKFANVLKSLGVKKGDVVAVYMPLVPELVIAAAGLCPDRRAAYGDLRRFQRRVAVGTDSGLQGQGPGHRRRRLSPRQARPAQGKRRWRRGLVSHAQARGRLPPDRHCTVNWSPGRDHWWHELEDQRLVDCPPEPLDSEHPLYILYTSGSTGKPKGILHTTGGYLVGTTLTTKWVFDLKDDDTYWCTADVGWVTGHSYLVYGPLSQRRDLRDVRGSPQLARRGPVLEDHRRLPGHDPLHRPDGHPGVHEVGRAVPAPPRPVEPPAAGHGRRADQPRGLDVVSQGHRRRSAARSSTPGGRRRPAPS